MKTLLALLSFCATVAATGQPMTLNSPTPYVQKSSLPTNDTYGLQGWWTLDSTAGTDSSGNGNTLTFSGSPSVVTGEITNAVQFNGTSQYATSPLTSLNYSSGTITWWMNPSTAYNAGTVRVPWGQMTGGNGDPEITCQVFSDNNWYVGWYASGNDARVTLAATSANYAQSTWNFYAFVWSASGSGLSVNGHQIGTNTAPPSVSNIGSDFCVARMGTAQNFYFSGALDDVRVYNRALSGPEIANQYQWPTGGRP